jgi:hypothetical protein
LTPLPLENETPSATNYVHDMENIDKSHLTNSNLVEVWSPELWRQDKKTGQMKQYRLYNDIERTETSTIPTEESEHTVYSPLAVGLTPVEEEKDDVNIDDNN